MQSGEVANHPSLSATGLIGLGAMGGAMATRLLNAGVELHLWARHPDATKPFAAMGATAHDNPQALAEHVDTLLINVTSTADVLSVIDKTMPGLRAGSLVIDFSTIEAGAAKNIAEQLAQRGIGFLDCPVSGGYKAAQAGTLSMMAGGTTTAFERAYPLLQHLGQTIVHVGPSGSGQVVKAANQMIMCANLVGIAEAFTYAKHFNADLPTMLKVLQGGFAASKVLDWVGPRMSGEDDSVLIQSRLHEKDLRMVANACAENNLNLPVMQQVAAHLSELVRQGKGTEDTSQVLTLVEQLAHQMS